VVIAEVKAIACELPALRAVPLSRFSIADVREEAIACGLVHLPVHASWLNQVEIYLSICSGRS
jgi:hypothetical protein